MQTVELSPSDAVLAVDVQLDFCPGGALAVPEGDRVVEVLNAWIRRAVEARALVIVTRDWHPRGHVSFIEQGGVWPEHCVQGTAGARFHPALALPEDAIVLAKGYQRDRDAYSAFDATGLVSILRWRGIRRVFVGGLAQDVCVRATVLDALRFGFETHIIVDATRPVDHRTGTLTLRELQECGAVVESESPPPP